MSISTQHRQPQQWRDYFAYAFVKALRAIADLFFRKRYGHRAVVLETVAAVPGLVGGLFQHLQALRLIRSDHGWIRELLNEAENERMHLMTFVQVAEPTVFERSLIVVVQALFFATYFVLYLVSAKTAHRVVGYFEEEAVTSYTDYLAEIEAGRLSNPLAPSIARNYWGLPADARLDAVVRAVRDDEAQHRDRNHFMADALRSGDRQAIPVPPKTVHAHT